MKIQKFQPNKDGVVTIYDCVRLLTMGIKDNVPTFWAATDPTLHSGQTIGFKVRKDGDVVTPRDCALYITSIINDTDTWHLFSQEQKITPVMMQPGSGPAPTQGPSGQILT